MNTADNKGGAARTMILLLAALAVGILFGAFGVARYLPMGGAHEEKSATKDEVPAAKGDAPASTDGGEAKTDDFFVDMGGSAVKPKPQKTGKILFYRNPMNATITSKVPAKDEMGMDYIPVYEGEDEEGGGTSGDRAPVRLDEDAIRKTGVATARAEIDSVSRTVRAAGRVAADERGLRTLTAKTGGWIEKLFVNYTGQYVKAGEPLLTIYSPELLSTQEEYLRAKKAAEKLSASQDPVVRAGAEDMARLAAKRLELYDVPKEAVAELARTGKATRTVTLNAPFSGYVTGREVYEGMKIEPGMKLVSVADLSRVWIEADLYGYEAALVAKGTEATVTVAGSGVPELKGKATFVDPVFNDETRTLRTRFEFPNPGLKLKPGMYAEVSIAMEAATGVAVPESAVMDTGERKLVFVEREKGVFEPRTVVTGTAGGGRVIIVSGLASGEMVVTRANFLLDSESRLRAAIKKAAAKAMEGEK